MLPSRGGDFIVKTAGKLKSITEQCEKENAKAKRFSDICPGASFFTAAVAVASRSPGERAMLSFVERLALLRLAMRNPIYDC